MPKEETIEIINKENDPCETCGYAEGSPFCLQYCPYDVERKKEQEPCEDAISREAVLNLCGYDKYNLPYEYKDYKGNLHRGYDEGRLINVTKLKQLPSVQPSNKVIEDIKAEIEGLMSHDNYMVDGFNVIEIIDKHTKGNKS